MTTSTSRKIATLLFASCATVLAALPAAAEDAIVGQEEFRLRCAVCHGMTGLGDGPIGLLLKNGPPDLTQVAARNDGKFPFARIFEIIDGKTEIVAHGTRTMPVWGEYYRGEPKPVTPDQADITAQMTQQRILALVYYIGTLQTKK